MQNVRPCGNDWHHPVTKARRLRGWEAFVTTLALAAIALVLLLALPLRAEEERRERIPGGCRELASPDADPRRSGARHRIPQSHERPGPGGAALPRGDAPPLVGSPAPN